MLLCEGSAAVLDMVRPKAQLLLAACEGEWGTWLGAGRSWGRPSGCGGAWGANLPLPVDHRPVLKPEPCMHSRVPMPTHVHAHTRAPLSLSEESPATGQGHGRA